MGRLYEYLQSVGSEAGLVFKAFWAPDFCVYANRPNEIPALVASLGSDGTVTFENRCQDLLSVSSADAGEAFSVFRRK